MSEQFLYHSGRNAQQRHVDDAEHVKFGTLCRLGISGTVCERRRNSDLPQFHGCRHARTIEPVKLCGLHGSEQSNASRLPIQRRGSGSSNDKWKRDDSWRCNTNKYSDGSSYGDIYADADKYRDRDRDHDRDRFSYGNAYANPNKYVHTDEYGDIYADTYKYGHGHGYRNVYANPYKYGHTDKYSDVHAD